MVKINNIDACINKLMFLTTDLNKNVFGNGNKNVDKNLAKFFGILCTCYCGYHIDDSRMNTISVVKHIHLIIYKNVDKISIKIPPKFFRINFDKCFNKNFHKNFNQNSDKNFGNCECLGHYKLLKNLLSSNNFNFYHGL